MLPVLGILARALLVGGGAVVLTIGACEIIEEMNERLMAGELADAEAAFERIRSEQDGELAEFYLRHREQMTHETRARFEQELGW